MKGFYKNKYDWIILFFGVMFNCFWVYNYFLDYGNSLWIFYDECWFLYVSFSVE